MWLMIIWNVFFQKKNFLLGKPVRQDLIDTTSKRSEGIKKFNLNEKSTNPISCWWKFRS